MKSVLSKSVGKTRRMSASQYLAVQVRLAANGSLHKFRLSAGGTISHDDARAFFEPTHNFLSQGDYALIQLRPVAVK